MRLIIEITHDRQKNHITFYVNYYAIIIIFTDKLSYFYDNLLLFRLNYQNKTRNEVFLPEVIYKSRLHGSEIKIITLVLPCIQIFL